MSRYAVLAIITALAFLLGTLSARGTHATAPVSAAATPAATVFELRMLEGARVFRFASRDVRRPLQRDRTEIQLIRSGSGSEWVGDRRVRVRPGTIVVLPPNTPAGRFEGGPFAVARAASR